LNISSTGSFKYQWFFSDFYVFMFLLFVESQGLIDRQHALLFYGVLGVTLVLKYLRFLNYVISKLCDYLDISLVRVKKVKEG